MNLNQVAVPSSALKKSISFYQTLGWKLIVESLLNYVRFQCSDRSSTFSIHHAEELPAGDGALIYFECKEPNDYVRKLFSIGINFDEMSEDKPWLWREARLKDPDNNQLVLYFAGENRFNPPWRVK